MSFDPSLLELVRCPVTHSSLKLADDGLVQRINEKIQQGSLCNRAGQLLDQELEAGLVNEDRSLLLPIRGGIMIMVVDQAIELNAQGSV